MLFMNIKDVFIAVNSCHLGDPLEAMQWNSVRLEGRLQGSGSLGD